MVDAEKAYAHLSRPFAGIDLDALDHNIAFINKSSAGKRIRIATKSIRSTALLHYINERLEKPEGYMTFDLNETYQLLSNGFDNLLLGYPQLEKEALQKIIPYLQEGRRVIFMIDSIDQWSWLELIGKQSAIEFEICIDLNVSTDFKFLYFGTKRSSLSTLAAVDALLENAKDFTFTKVTGVMGYEAQIAGITDKPVVSWQAPLIKQLKRMSKKSVQTFRKNAVARIKKAYPTIQFVNGGGTGSIDFTSADADVTEVTIGSAFYFPALFSGYKNLSLKPATTFALRVTRLPEKGIAVCHGGGYIASGAVGVDKNPLPVWPTTLSFLKNEGAGEVQTPLSDPKNQLKIGDTVYFRHAKAGELCERFTVLHGRRGSTYEGMYETYRGEGSCFL